MKRFVCLLGLLLVASVFAAAQKCTQATVLGTYAFQTSGSVLAGAPPTANTPLTTSAIHRDLAMVGMVTFKADWTATGFYWQANGAQTNLTRLPWAAGYTINPDCTGYYEYATPLATKNVRENFVVLDNGYEIRMMLSSDANVIGAQMPFALMNYGGVAYRMSKVSAPYCSRSMFRNTRYVATCAGSMVQDVASMGGSMVLSTNSMIDIKVTGDINVNADHLTKVGPSLKQFNVTGAAITNTDCTMEAALVYNDPAFTGTVHVRGVVFDSGTRAFALPLLTTLGDGSTMPFQGWTCSWKKMPAETLIP